MHEHASVFKSYPSGEGGKCDKVRGCDIQQHVGIDTSVANVWLALVITLLLLLITSLKKPHVCLSVCASVCSLTLKTHLPFISVCMCAVHVQMLYICSWNSFSHTDSHKQHEDRRCETQGNKVRIEIARILYWITLNPRNERKFPHQIKC